MHKPNLRPPTVAQRLDEVFDVVDEHDRVIGQATRGEVHARKLWHRAIHVLVVNSRGEVFLQKRSAAKDSWPGAWDSSCSGHLDAGEDYRTAAVRELQEEIGLAVQPSDLTQQFQLSPSDETGWEFVFVFTLRSHLTPVTNPAEIERGEWFTPTQIAQAIAENPSTFGSAFRLHWPRSSLTITDEV